MGNNVVPEFEIDGLDKEMRTFVKQINVDQVHDGPTVFEITFVNRVQEDNGGGAFTHKGGKYQFESKFKEGKEVGVSMGFVKGERPQKLVTGEVAGFESSYRGNGPNEFVVRGFDKLHRLTRGRHQRSFQNMKDSDIASQIAGEAGLGIQADDSKYVHDHVFQNNLTNLQFLYMRARRIGFEVTIEDDTLIFKKPRVDQGPVTTIKWDPNVRNARFRMSTARQAKEVQVRGWDPKTKKEIVGKASAGDEYSQMDGSDTGGQIVSGKYGGTGDSKVVVVGLPMNSVEEANNMAKGYFNSIAMGLVEGEMDVSGDPKLKAGKIVKLEEFGDRYNGNYYIVRARHYMRAEVGERGGFRTRLTLKRAGINTM